MRIGGLLGAGVFLQLKRLQVLSLVCKSFDFLFFRKINFCVKKNLQRLFDNFFIKRFNIMS